jgi:hypothetical protein
MEGHAVECTYREAALVTLQDAARGVRIVMELTGRAARAEALVEIWHLGQRS